MTWADYAIVLSIPIFIIGGGAEGWRGETRWFIQKTSTMVAVNAVAFVLLISGLYYQDYTSADGGLEVFRQIWTAFVRVFASGGS